MGARRVKTADIMTEQVLAVVVMMRTPGWASQLQRQLGETLLTAPALLSLCTGAPPKVAIRALEREERRRMIDWGTSCNFPFLTSQGEARVAELMS